MEIAEAFGCATANSPPASNRFYGPIGDAALGAGMFLANVEYPTFIVEEDRYGLVRGLVLVLTHECDLDQANERLLNDIALICPVIPLENFVAALPDALSDPQIGDFLGNITSRYINRLVYLPIVPEVLPRGGYLYLNLLTNTHLGRLLQEEVSRVCVLSGDGWREVDHALERHLRRPKADRLPFQPPTAEGPFGA